MGLGRTRGRWECKLASPDGGLMSSSSVPAASPCQGHSTRTFPGLKVQTVLPEVRCLPPPNRGALTSCHRTGLNTSEGDPGAETEVPSPEPVSRCPSGSLPQAGGGRKSTELGIGTLSLGSLIFRTSLGLRHLTPTRRGSRRGL